MEGHKDGVGWETITRNRCISWHLVGDARGHLRARGKVRGKGMMEGMALIGEERDAEWVRTSHRTVFGRHHEKCARFNTKADQELPRRATAVRERRRAPLQTTGAKVVPESDLCYVSEILVPALASLTHSLTHSPYPLETSLA